MTFTERIQPQGLNERPKTSELTAEQHKTKQELERAPTLTDFVGVIYDRIPYIASEHTDGSLKGKKYTPDELVGQMLLEIDRSSGRDSERSGVTNAVYGLQGLMKKKFIGDKQKGVAAEVTPTGADLLLRKYFDRKALGKSTPMPYSDLPTDPEFYRKSYNTSQGLRVLSEIQPTMRGSTNEQFVRLLLRKKNVFGSADTIEELITLLKAQKTLPPDVRTNHQGVAKPINAKPIALLLEDWFRGKGGDKPMNILMNILQDHFELSVTIRRLAFKRVEQIEKQSKEKFSDFVQQYPEVQNALASIGGERLKVVGVGMGGSQAKITFRPDGERTSEHDIEVVSMTDLRAKGIRFESRKLQEALLAAA